jgi:hypothetical protein
MAVDKDYPKRYQHDLALLEPLQSFVMEEEPPLDIFTRHLVPYNVRLSLRSRAITIEGRVVEGVTGEAIGQGYFRNRLAGLKDAAALAKTAQETPFDRLAAATGGKASIAEKALRRLSGGRAATGHVTEAENRVRDFRKQKANILSQFSKSTLWRAPGEFVTLEGRSGSPLEIMTEGSDRGRLLGLQSWQMLSSQRASWAIGDEQLRQDDTDATTAKITSGIYPIYGSFALPEDFDSFTFISSAMIPDPAQVGAV